MENEVKARYVQKEGSSEIFEGVSLDSLDPMSIANSVNFNDPETQILVATKGNKIIYKTIEQTEDTFIGTGENPSITVTESYFVIENGQLVGLIGSWNHNFRWQSGYSHTNRF